MHKLFTTRSLAWLTTLLLAIGPLASWAQTLTEDFESGTKAAYAAAPVTLTSGTWNFSDAVVGTTAGSDRFNGAKAARLRNNGFIAMSFDKPNGAGTITVNAGLYGSDAAATFTLELSTNGGTSYTAVPGVPAALTNTLTPYTFTVNQSGAVRLRIGTSNTTTTTAPRVNIDDVSITDAAATATPTITATPASLAAFSTAVGTPSATQTITVGGTSLTADIVAAAPAGYEVSLSATTGFAATTTVPQTSGTAANTPLYVRLSGAAAGTFAGNVALTSAGATPANVALTGTVSTVATPAPTITSFTPASGPVGTTVTVTGTDLAGATGATLNGTAVTGFMAMGATSVMFDVPTGATTGPIAVATPGGTATSATSFTVTATSPVPVITSLTPNSVVAGAGGFTVVVTGTGFVANSAVRSSAPVSLTTYISPTQLSVTLPPGAVVGTYFFTVTNPAPGGGVVTSNTVNFTVTAAPTLTSISPNTAAAGSAAFTLTATGTNFTASSVISFNGVALATTLVSATSLTATVPATAVATAGVVPVTVTTSTPGGTTSAAVNFTVTALVAAPTVTAFSPARAVTGVGFTLTVSGTSLVAGTTVSFNGVTYPGTVVGTTGTGLTVVIPASGVPAPGTYNITATNSAGTSAPLSFLVVAASTVATFEDFEQGTKGGYGTGIVTLRSGDWTFTDALLGNLFNDKVDQVQSARIRGGGSIAMNFDKTGGAGVITFNAGLYGNDAAASFILEVSTNGGTSYTTVAGPPAALTATLSPYSFTVNRTGGVRLRISSTNAAAGTNPRINIDNLTITGYTGTATLAANALPGLSVFPNPATDRITVALPTAGAATVALRDLTGRVVLAPAMLGADKQLVLPATLARGIYLLEVKQGGVTAVRRIEKN